MRVHGITIIMIIMEGNRVTHVETPVTVAPRVEGVPRECEGGRRKEKRGKKSA